LVAGVVSGLPSTAWALVRRRDPLTATWAAGRLLAPNAPPGPRLVAAAVFVHATITVGWTAVLTVVLPRHRRVLAGACGGLAIAALDLGLARLRPGNARLAGVAALPQWAQVLDHVAFGALVGAYPRTRAGSGRSGARTATPAGASTATPAGATGQ
jgi:hypothetical protein